MCVKCIYTLDSIYIYAVNHTCLWMLEMAWHGQAWTMQNAESHPEMQPPSCILSGMRAFDDWLVCRASSDAGTHNRCRDGAKLAPSHHVIAGIPCSKRPAPSAFPCRSPSCAPPPWKTSCAPSAACRPRRAVATTGRQALNRRWACTGVSTPEST